IRPLRVPCSRRPASYLSWQRVPDRRKHQAFVDAGHDGDLADPPRQHEMYPALDRLLVRAEPPEQVLRRDSVERGDRSVAIHNIADRRAGPGTEMAGQLGEPRRRLHPERDRLTMQKSRVTGLGFERVADGVAEVQDLAQPALALVRGNDFGLDPDR